VTEPYGSGPHSPAAKLATGRPFAAGPDARRNGGGRPQGLARLAREAVGDDGEDLVKFFTAVLRADRKFLGERRVALRDRMAAGVWLADRAFGKAIQVVEIRDPQEEQIQELRQEIVEMPPALREQLGRWLLERRNAMLRAEREAVEARVKSMLPPAEPLNPEENGVR
jgi:hypothetical protein